MTDARAAARAHMLAHDLRGRGLTEPRVLAAMAAVPRERFVPGDAIAEAYADRPLPIAAGQTISQPYIVALMAAALALTPGDRVLDVGTGSGYAAAVFAELVGAASVWSIERHAALADAARATLAAAGYPVEVRCGDGTRGWPERAPFDAIAVAAAAEEVPAALLAQLAVGGRLVMPVGPPGLQTLVRLTREGPARLRQDDLGPVTFVPLIAG